MLRYINMSDDKIKSVVNVIYIIALVIMTIATIYSCSVVFIKGRDNTVVDPDNYRIRHDRNLHINEKDTVNNIKKDTVWK